MDIERKLCKSEKSINPSCIKENNLNNINLFDNSLKSKKKVNDGFLIVTKLKRNFK